MKKKAAVVFHSVSGNTYTMAKRYQEALCHQGIEAMLFRVDDHGSLEMMAKKTHAEAGMVDRIREVPIAAGTDMWHYDAIFLGTPTYFGNVSSQMKGFFEEMYELWSKAALAGRPFGAFATVATEAGGVEFGLLGLLISALHMGLIPISVPATVMEGTVPAYGLTYHSTPRGEALPGADTLQAIDEYIAYCAPIIKAISVRKEPAPQ